jgi:methanethiol S-methyltransferase
MKYFLLVFWWSAYCFLHSYLISIRFTTLMTRWLKNYYSFYRLAYVTISILLFIPLLKWTAGLHDPVMIVYPFPWSIVRYMLLTSSLIMFFWAFFFDYDALSFFGFRQMLKFGKNETADPTEKFKVSRLLGITRHPMYFALIVYLWCQTFTVSDIIVHIVLTIYVIIGTVLEENKLLLEFGDRYVHYQQQVPMLIPFVKIQFVWLNAINRINVSHILESK